MRVQVPSLRLRNAQCARWKRELIGALPEKGMRLSVRRYPGPKSLQAGENSPYKPREKMHGL
jgi:hypothetical protein